MKQKGLKITKEQDQWIKDKCINFNLYIRAFLNEQMKQEKEVKNETNRI